MFSKPQIHHKLTPRLNSTIIPGSSDITKISPTPQHLQNFPKNPKIYLNIKTNNHKRGRSQRLRNLMLVAEGCQV